MVPRVYRTGTLLAATHRSFYWINKSMMNIYYFSVGAFVTWRWTVLWTPWAFTISYITVHFILTVSRMLCYMVLKKISYIHTYKTMIPPLLNYVMIIELFEGRRLKVSYLKVPGSGPTQSQVNLNVCCKTINKDPMSKCGPRPCVSRRRRIQAKETGHLWLYYIYMTVFIRNAANLAQLLL
jgi:hypothetical protein